MALKLTNLEAHSVPILNRWAAQQDNLVQSHTTQLAQLQIFLDRLFKLNPSLVKPTANPSNPKQ